jgi:hypothetical protein
MLRAKRTRMSYRSAYESLATDSFGQDQCPEFANMGAERTSIIGFRVSSNWLGRTQGTVCPASLLPSEFSVSLALLDRSLEMLTYSDFSACKAELLDDWVIPWHAKQPSKWYHWHKV